MSWDRAVEQVCDLLDSFRTEALLHRRMFELALAKAIRRRKADIAEILFAKGTEIFGRAFGTLTCQRPCCPSD